MDKTGKSKKTRRDFYPRPRERRQKGLRECEKLTTNTKPSLNHIPETTQTKAKSRALTLSTRATRSLAFDGRAYCTLFFGYTLVPVLKTNFWIFW
jgi:cytoplasmic iron level regulating protein YaaA (DUF328/UPF0246 family)